MTLYLHLVYSDSSLPTQGLADIAHSKALGEDENKFSRVDLDDTAQVILMGVTEEQHQKHCQELSRLQAMYSHSIEE